MISLLITRYGRQRLVQLGTGSDAEFLEDVRRWKSTVLALMNSWAAISTLDRPLLASLAILASCGDSSPGPADLRLRGRVPVAASSARVRSANSRAPMAVNISYAVPR